MSIVVDTCELHSAFDGQCFGCVVASFHAQCRCISDLRDRVQKLEGALKAAGDLIDYVNHAPGCRDYDKCTCGFVETLAAYRQALSPNGTEGGGNG